MLEFPHKLWKHEDLNTRRCLTRTVANLWLQTLVIAPCTPSHGQAANGWAILHHCQAVKGWDGG